MHLVLDGNSAGPFTLDQVRAMWAEGKINGQTYFFRDGMAEWQPLERILPEIFPEAPPPFQTPTVVPVLAGFWRRFLGFVLDLILLGVFGFALGTILFDFFSSMGHWALLVGFLIAGGYFVVLNSKLGGGRTVGKMALGTRVVGADGQGLSLGQSMLRYAVWAVPYFAAGTQVSVAAASMWTGNVFFLFLWTFFFAAIYLLAFNHRTHQTVQDLATRSYVVRALPGGPIEMPPIWRGHFIFIGVWLCLGLGLLYVLSMIYATQFISGMVDLQRKVNTAVPDVGAVSVEKGVNYFFTGGGPSMTRAVTVSARFYHRVSDDDKLAREIAAVVLKNSTDANNSDILTIKLLRSYNLGIASSSWSEDVSHTPKEWLSEIASAGK